MTGPAERAHSRNPMTRMVDAVVPTVIGAIPVDDVVSRIDVAALLERIEPDDLLARIDVDALMARIDLDGTLARIDLTALLTRLDLNAVLAGVDLNALLADVELDALLAGVDVDGLIGRIDIDALMARVDINALLDRVDIDRLVQRVDLDALLAGVDIDGIIGRARVGDIVAKSAGEVGGSSLDLARRQLVALDLLVSRSAERVIGRRRGGPDGPPLLVGLEPLLVGRPERHQVTGHYAGPVTRLLSYIGDTAAITFLYGFLVAGVTFVLQLISETAVVPDRRAALLWAAGYAAWYFTYTAATVAGFGRTPVKAIVGLRVVARDGGPLGAGGAILRALALPVSLTLALIALPGVVLGHGRRTLHDAVARSAVVYDWGDRPAELPTPISRYLEARSVLEAEREAIEQAG